MVARALVEAGALGESKLATFRHIPNGAGRRHTDVASLDRHPAAMQFILEGMRPPAGFDLLASRHEGGCVVCARALDCGRV